MKDYLTELADLPAINEGVGWYWTRGGLRAVVPLISDLSEDEPMIGYIFAEDGELANGWDNGHWHCDTHANDSDDLVRFIGPDKPVQETYNEWRAAQELEQNREPDDLWLVSNGHRSQHCLTTPQAVRVFLVNNPDAKVTHYRRVSEGAYLPLPSVDDFVRTQPERKEVRCWARVRPTDKDTIFVTTSLESTAESWKVAGWEVVECVGYRQPIGCPDAK